MTIVIVNIVLLCTAALSANAQITSFTASNPSPIVGETITLSCSATGDTAPDFQFWSGMRSSFNTPYLEIVESKTVSQAGNTSTATLKVKAILANNLRNGESLTCRTELDGVESKRELKVTTYFNCNTVPVKSLNPDGNGATITQTDLGGGSLKQTISCPADTSTTKYKLATHPNSGEEITCTRETGKYQPPYLGICQETRAFSSGRGEQRMTIPTSAEKPAPCTSDAAGEWSISVMKQKLNSLTDTNCGFRHAVSCLKSGACTLDTTRSGCRYESGKIIMEYFVNFNSPVWTLVQRDGLVQLEGKVRFWSCSETYG